LDPELNVEAHQEQSFDLADLIRIALVALVATATWFRLWQPLPRLDVATTRLLNGGPEVCKRVEEEAIEAIKKAEWNLARKLLNLRLQMRSAPTTGERIQINRILTLIDEAEANGVGPHP
jgi:hypothetical protein